MTFVVPFDGTDLSRSALASARLYSIAFEDSTSEIVEWLLPEQPLDVVAISIIPESRRYAQRKGWIREDEDFNPREIAEELHKDVANITPNANFQYERIDGVASVGTISARIRQKAYELDASVLFIGSENAGRLVTPLSSVGHSIAADQRYDVHLVRKPIPEPQLRKLKSKFSPRN